MFLKCFRLWFLLIQFYFILSGFTLLFFFNETKCSCHFLLKNFTQIIYQFRLHQACLYSIIDIPLQMATTLIEQIT